MSYLIILMYSKKHDSKISQKDYRCSCVRESIFFFSLRGWSNEKLDFIPLLIIFVVKVYWIIWLNYTCLLNNRYTQNGVKITTPVEFPLEGLDVCEYTQLEDCPPEQFLYDLIGCVCHQGSTYPTNKMRLSTVPFKC